MARREIITLIDDVDGSEASGTLQFALDGTRYEIDLNEANETALRDALVPFVSAARRVDNRTSSRRRRGSRVR